MLHVKIQRSVSVNSINAYIFIVTGLYLHDDCCDWGVGVGADLTQDCWEISTTSSDKGQPVKIGNDIHVDTRYQ